MKKLFLIVTLLFWAGTLFAQREDPKYPSRVAVMAQLQAAKLKAHNYKVLYKAADAKADSLVIIVAKLIESAIALNRGIEKTRIILQKGIDNNGKVDFESLVADVAWNLVLKPDSTSSDKKPKR